jgi:hypothetical protein
MVEQELTRRGGAGGRQTQEIDPEGIGGGLDNPVTSGVQSPDLQTAIERERLMSPEGRAERDRQSREVDEEERHIFEEELEGERTSMRYWMQLAQEAAVNQDADSRGRFMTRARAVEDRLVQREDQRGARSATVLPSAQGQVQPAATGQVSATPVTQVIESPGVVDNITQVITQNANVENGTVIRFTMRGSAEPMFLQKTPQGWLILSRDPSAQAA